MEEFLNFRMVLRKANGRLTESIGWYGQNQSQFLGIYRIFVGHFQSHLRLQSL